MKQRWIFAIPGIIIALFFASCISEFFNGGEEKITSFEDTSNKASTTFVSFNNANNTFDVEIYNSYIRSESTVIDIVRAGQTSFVPHPWFPAPDGFTFYLTYYLPVAAEEIPYSPPNAFVLASIPKDTTTAVGIPPLGSLVFSPNEPLFNDDVWLVLENNHASAIQLYSGTSIVEPVSGPILLNPGTLALYKLHPVANTAAYSIYVQGFMETLPHDLRAFERGWFYYLDINNTEAVLRESKLLTLNNLK